MPTNRNWVKMVKIQVRSVLFSVASRARMRSGDQLVFVLNSYSLGLKKEKPKKCGFAGAGTRGERSRRAPGCLSPQFPFPPCVLWKEGFRESTV